ncbi:MAG: phenylalanine--tRNA ligase subunit alpha [Planctomycetaceae bacterium]|nr:phenylalanine--tRNA ligase subunit alpha [Planctomycetaceae bacterium]
MALADFVNELDQLSQQASEAFTAAADVEALEAARIEFLGAKSGRLKATQKQMGKVDKSDRPEAGKRLNQVKQAIESAFNSANERLSSGSAQDSSEAIFDASLPGTREVPYGRLHPISQTIDELMDIMGRLGFSAAEGPEIEDDWHNFEALNIPREHPARDPLDNFYLSTAKQNSADASSDHDVLLLRSQTSTVQIRVMSKTPPPIRIISLGRVYRPDTADATHYPMFHQMEGLLIDKQVTMADLKSVLRLFATSYLGSEVHIRFRPSFFPFTEPSVEADFSWNGSWIEFGGAGMVDPNVLKAVGYDPDEVTGFAFGLGVERLCMRRHGITDIREFYKNDVRFLQQF